MPPTLRRKRNQDFYVCADQSGCAGGWGGTSFAAPMWAGFMALVNQQSTADGGPPVGFINPIIYPLGVTADYNSSFHDIVTGSNGFPAVAGYDLVTGWGSPFGTGTINALLGKESPTFNLTASPSSLSLAQNTSGTSTITVNDFYGFASDVTLSASGAPSGVTTGFGTNPTASTSKLTITIGPSVPGGTYTLVVSGTSGTLTASTTIQLTVAQLPSPVVNLSPASLNFGSVVVGATSAAKAVTVSNSGQATLKISSIAAGGEFAIASNTCGSTLAVGAKCKLTVTFTPTQAESVTSAIALTDNAANSTQVVTLSGTGIAPATLTPAAATFAKTAVGASSAAKTFKLANKQSVALTGISITPTGNFSVSATTCSSTLAAKSTCEISVIFKPTQAGPQTGTLEVKNSAYGSPEGSSLTGTGK